MIELKNFKKWSICHQAQLYQTVWTLKKFEVDVSKISREKANNGKEKKENYLLVSVSHRSNEKNKAKSMTIFGRSPVEHRGNLSIRTSVPLPLHPQGFVSFGAQIQTVWPKSEQNGPKLAKSRQNGLRPGKMGLIWLENLNSGLSSIILAP